MAESQQDVLRSEDYDLPHESMVCAEFDLLVSLDR